MALVPPGGPDPFTHGSPSQVFGWCSCCWRRCCWSGWSAAGRSGGWVVLALAVAAAPGSKPAVLPVLIAAVGGCLLANLVRRGRSSGPVDAWR